MILLIDLIFMKPSEERVDYDYQNLENHRSGVNHKNQKNHSSDDIPHCLLFFKHIRHIRAHKKLIQLMCPDVPRMCLVRLDAALKVH